MTRIALIDDSDVNVLLRTLFVVARRVTKKLTGKAILTAPIRAHAHSMGLFFGMSMMERAQSGIATVPAQLKALASLRVSTLIGCPF